VARVTEQPFKHEITNLLFAKPIKPLEMIHIILLSLPNIIKSYKCNKYTGTDIGKY